MIWKGGKSTCSIKASSKVHAETEVVRLLLVVETRVVPSLPINWEKRVAAEPVQK